MVDMTENKVLIREFNEDRDIEVVGKLEKNCEIGSKNGVALFTNMMADPLCRIRFYADHIMLVAELQENGELVGVVRGCIKCVGTKFGGTYVKLGCILGLRVSPNHRRMGIGLHLVKSVEEWMVRNGAHYAFLATEKHNLASTNLFTTKCNYVNFSSLVIFVQPISCLPLEGLSQDIKIEKLHVDQAVSLYTDRLKTKDVYPTDIESILKEKLSLGTWVSYFREEKWFHFEGKEKNNENGDVITKTPSSWVMFSIWNYSCEAYKIHIRKSRPFKFLHVTLSHAKEKILPACLKMLPMCSSLGRNPFGFLFLYGLYGEGERLGELMKSVWSFASRLAVNVKQCEVIMTELGVSDPLIQHVPKESSITCIDDLWYFKKVNYLQADVDKKELNNLMGQFGNVFVDPRDF